MGNRVLAVGLYIEGTGFTRVLDSIFSRLASDFDIHLIGIAYRGGYSEKELHPISK